MWLLLACAPVEVGSPEDSTPDEVWTVVDSQLPGFGSLVEAFGNWEDIWQ